MQTRAPPSARVSDKPQLRQVTSVAVSAVGPEIRGSDFTLLHTTPLLTKPLLVDLSQSGSVLHSIASGPCSPVPAVACNCVHYGFCAPVTLPVHDPSEQQFRSHRVHPAATIGRDNESSADLPGRLSHSTAFNLIANDDESHDLQHLINTFITGEKMKQQSLNNKMSSNTLQTVKLRPIGNRLSQSMNNLNALTQQQKPSFKAEDLYVRGRSSHSPKILSPSLGVGAGHSLDFSPQSQTQPLIVSSNSKIRIDKSGPKSTVQVQADGDRSLNTGSGENGTVRVPDNNAAPVPVPERVASKLIFGLCDKTNKNKYLQLANDRNQQAPVCRVRTGSAQPSQSSAAAAADSSIQQSSSDPVGRTSDERFANQLMQLTDDEKVQYIIASHTSLQKNGTQGNASVQAVDPAVDALLHDKSQVKAKLKETSKESLLQPKVNAAPKTNLSKYRSLSCDSLYGSKQLIDFKTYQGPQMIEYSSPFDYAKTRFINSFILSGLKVPDKRLTPSQDVVLQTKNKLLERTVTSQKGSESPEPKCVARRSPVDLNVMKIPVRNPVKPYLSRGSVAERVLLFEKCPESRSLVQTSRRSKSPVLYRHWKNPSKEAVSITTSTI